jgi:hypothetical protein
MAMLKFRAPPLPIAGPDYKQDYFSQLIRALGLYFNQLDSTTPSQWDQVIATNFTGGLFSGEGYGIQFPHVAASDSTEQYATGNDTPTLVNWNTLRSQSGWALNAPGSATAQYAGIYKITYELQLANDNNTAHDVFFWLRVNGIDVVNSTTAYTVPARKSVGNPSYVSAYSEVVFPINANDEIELYWATDQAATSGGTAGVYLHHQVAQTTPYARPATPSARGSIIFVSALPDPNVSGVYASGYVGTVTVSIS